MVDNSPHCEHFDPMKKLTEYSSFYPFYKYFLTVKYVVGTVLRT